MRNNKLTGYFYGNIIILNETRGLLRDRKNITETD